MAEARGSRKPEVIADLAGIPRRTYREIEKGNAAAELDVVVNIARALGVSAASLVAPMFLLTPERAAVNEAWASAALDGVRKEARAYGALVHQPRVISAIVSLTVIAEKSPEELPGIAALLGSRAQDLHLPFADRLRTLQGIADNEAARLSARKSPPTRRAPHGGTTRSR